MLISKLTIIYLVRKHVWFSLDVKFCWIKWIGTFMIGTFMMSDLGLNINDYLI